MEEDKYIVIDCETTGLRAYESRVTCICAYCSDGTIFCASEDSEIKIIKGFLDYLNSKQFSYLVSANGKDFDVPFLLIRGYTLGISFGDMLRLYSEHIDIINDVTFRRISLDDLARLFGFETKTGNGLKAIQLFKERKFQELTDYCLNDVMLTKLIYQKMKEVKNAGAKVEIEKSNTG